MWKKILSILVLSIVVQSYSFAQFSFENLSAGVGLSYTNYASLGVIGLQPRIAYNYSEKSSIVFGFNYGLPSAANNGSVSLRDLNTLGGSKTVNVETTYKFRTFFINGQYYFLKDNEEPFGMYGLFGASYVYVGLESKTEPFDTIRYQPYSPLPENEPAEGFGIHAGLGAHFKVKLFKFFGEAQIGLPANRVQGTYFSNPIPTHFILNAGVMIAFAK